MSSARVQAGRASAHDHLLRVPELESPEALRLSPEPRAEGKRQ